jgi:hypothetical protein
MHTLRKLLRLPPAELRLVVAATLLVIAVRAGLWLLPYPVVRRLAARLGHPMRRHRLPAARIAWAVAAVGRRVPGGRNCLAQALVALVLLGRHSHQAVIRLGVTHATGGRFEAHAWLEHDGLVLVGGQGVARYTPLPAPAGDVT